MELLNKLGKGEVIDSGYKMNKEKMSVEIVNSHNSDIQILRELIQNSFCEKVGSTEFHIIVKEMKESKYGSRTICIDNGSGMSQEEAKLFKNFGYTTKDPKKHIGHKGIGAKSLYASRGGAKVITKREDDSLFVINLHPTDLGENPTTVATVEKYEGKTLYDAFPNALVKNQKSGTIIIMDNLDHINLNTSIEWLKEIINRYTHLGGYNTLPTFKEGDYKEYPLVSIAVGDKKEEFYAFRRIFSEKAMKIVNSRMAINSLGKKPIKFETDKIANSNQLRTVLETLNNSDYFKYDYENVFISFNNMNVYSSMYLISAVNGELLYKPVRGSAKDVARGTFIGTDGLPNHQTWKNNMSGFDFNVHQNYSEKYIDIPNASLTTNRNEIIGYGTTEFNDFLNYLKGRYINILVDRNKRFLQSILDRKNKNERINYEHRKPLSEYENCIELSNEFLVSFPKKNVVVPPLFERNERGLISLLWHIQDRIDPETGEALIPYQLRMETGGNGKGIPDLKAIPDENIEVLDGLPTYSEGNVKNVEVEVTLPNFCGHGHSTEVMDIIFCWGLGSWKVNQVKVVNGVDVVLCKEDNNYFLHAEDGDKKIPIIVMDDIIKQYPQLISKL